MCINLVLADPHPMMLKGLAHAFRDSTEFDVKSCVTNGEDALQALQQHRPHILVMDLSLSQRTGLALLAEIKTKKWPTRPVVFTDAPIEEVLLALEADVQGLVSKGKAKDLLLRCIKLVHEGGKWLDHDLSDQSMALLMEQKRQKAQNFDVLTPREMTVARLVTEGLPNKRIASQLAISEGTAKLHLHHIYQKLNCSGRMSLQRRMQEQGLA
jgi:DNA-binding NarL/FixJ family response regulator